MVLDVASKLASSTRFASLTDNGSHAGAATVLRLALAVAVVFALLQFGRTGWLKYAHRGSFDDHELDGGRVERFMLAVAVIAFAVVVISHVGRLCGASQMMDSLGLCVRR